jgi:hypothetical protein
MRWRVAACVLTMLADAAPAASGQSRPGWFNLPVQGGAPSLAALGIPVEERAQALPLLARALHDRETGLARSPRLVTDLVRATTTPAVGADTIGESIDIPAPLDAETWRRLLELPADGDLFARLLTDRRALLLAAALTATDDSVRALVMRDRDLLRWLYREGAEAFMIAARSLAVANGRVVAAGGDDAGTIWEALAGAPPTQPAAFVRALLTRDQGRLAWYFDTIARLDAQRLRAVWPAAADGRAAAARSLYEIFRDADPQWHATEQPFRRAIADPWMVVALIDVADGGVARPNTAAFWRIVFDDEAADIRNAARQLARESEPLTFPALARLIVLQSPRERRQRFEAVRLVQRVFAAAPPEDLPAVAAAVSGYKRFPALLLTLERMGVSSPATWVGLVAAARHVSDDAERTTDAVAAFQGALALTARLRHVRSLDAAAADRLLQALSAAVQRDRKACDAIVTWIADTLLPALPPLERPDAFTRATSYESRLLQALAGPPGRASHPLDWEGLRYTVDLVAAEHARLRAVRASLPTAGLDAAIASRQPRDLSSALTALVYATALGHPDGAAALSRDVATRHDFGFAATAIVQRLLPWSLPEERQGDGPWHVAGALLGLDTGLARLALRRVADEQMPQAPVLTLNDFATLSRTIVTLVPADLTDEDRDAMAAAIGRGRARVAAARGDSARLLELARAVAMPAATAATLPWVAAHDPAAADGCFSLRDLLWLGGVDRPQTVLDRWGVAAAGLDGRPLTAMPPPAAWEDFAGRPDAGQMATQVPDLTLRLVEETARLRLPAALVPALLAYAVEDFWHDAQARFADDWPRMTRQAAALTSSRIEDYVAALVGDGVLRPQ